MTRWSFFLQTLSLLHHFLGLYYAPPDAHITGATSITYVPVAADTGKTIRVRVRFTDDLNYSEQRTSAATAAVNAPATGEPTISGITQVGETLTADPSLIMDANGLTSPGYTYQWIRVDGTDINIPRATNTDPLVKTHFEEIPAI